MRPTKSSSAQSAEQNWKAGGAALAQIRMLIGINLSIGLLTIAVVFRGAWRCSKTILEAGSRQGSSCAGAANRLLRGLPDCVRPGLALQFGMKLPVAIQVNRGQMKNVEIARHPGGFADIHFIKRTGLVRQRTAATAASMRGTHRNAAR